MTIPESQLGTLGAEVPVAEVGSGLRSMWQDEGAGTKASLTNLAIYNENPEFLSRNAGLLAEVTSEHACRGILICNVHEAGEASSARSWITAHCQLRDGKKAACSEQIAFLLQNGSADAVRNLVFSHLDSDLPLVLWWQGTLSDRFEDRFYSVVDHLILDSARWKNPATDFATLLAATEEAGSRFSISDISWTRTHQMRVALATCFEDPINLAKLPHLRCATITHGKDSRVPALLLLAWIADRLGGTAAKTDEGNYEVRSANDDSSCPRLAIQLVAEGEGEHITSLQLDGAECEFTFLHAPDSRVLKTRLCSDGYCTERLLPADPLNRATLLLQQIGRKGARTLYSRTIPAILDLL